MNKERTVDEAIVYCDDVIMGKTHTPYNDADKKDCQQLRDWLKELKVLRRSQKGLMDMHKKMNPKSEIDIINDLISITEELTIRRKEIEKIRGANWIKCADEFPENNIAVNVVYVNHNPESYYSALKDKPFTATAVRYNNEWYWWSSTVQDYLSEYGSFDTDKIDKGIEITHWQPMPEPEGGEKMKWIKDQYISEAWLCPYCGRPVEPVKEAEDDAGEQ